MADPSRLEDLRRRVEKDPASIAFAQLAEEYRRAGQFAESVAACRAGLVIHPGYLSARVTLGRALIELGQLDEAQHELELVLKSASENLAAIRGLGEIFHKRGDLPAALTQYRAALLLARNDPDLEQTVSDLTAKVAPQARAVAPDALSLADVRQFLQTRQQDAPPIVRVRDTPAVGGSKDLPYDSTREPRTLEPRTPEPRTPEPRTLEPAASAPLRAVRVVAALEQWLVAIHAARTEQRA